MRYIDRKIWSIRWWMRVTQLWSEMPIFRPEPTFRWRKSIGSLENGSCPYECWMYADTVSLTDSFNLNENKSNEQQHQSMHEWRIILCVINNSYYIYDVIFHWKVHPCSSILGIISLNPAELTALSGISTTKPKTRFCSVPILNIIEVTIKLTIWHEWILTFSWCMKDHTPAATSAAKSMRSRAKN